MTAIKELPSRDQGRIGPNEGRGADQDAAGRVPVRLAVLSRPCGVRSSARIELRVAHAACFRRQSAQSPEGGAITTTSRPASRQRCAAVAAAFCPDASASAAIVSASIPPSTGIRREPKSLPRNTFNEADFPFGQRVSVLQYEGDKIGNRTDILSSLRC